jgi:hypothetical protein
MPIHMIKLCVGVASPDELRAWRAERAALGQEPMVTTRQTPKRADELLDGGSLYWVIKGQVLLRQRIVGIETKGEGAGKRCHLSLDGKLIDTAPQPRRAFQGWRYFEAKDAPPDLSDSGDEAAIPLVLAQRLREMGAW